MAHAKFQSPSINIDRFFQISAGETEKVSKLVSEGTKMWNFAFAPFHPLNHQNLALSVGKYPNKQTDRHVNNLVPRES